MRPVFLCDAVRTPIGRYGGVLASVRTDDLAAARPSAATTLSIGEVRGALARIPVESIMRRDVATIVPDTPIAEAARLMRDGRGPLAVLAGDDLVGLVGAAELLSEVEREESR